jgi:hypothetical protein
MRVALPRNAPGDYRAVIQAVARREAVARRNDRGE